MLNIKKVKPKQTQKRKVIKVVTKRWRNKGKKDVDEKNDRREGDEDWQALQETIKGRY